jgi:hypothetical protein
MSSCRRDEYVYKEPLGQDPLVKESLIANLIKKTTLKDGSIDNILDYASCITVKLPVTVNANGIDVVVNTSDDYNDIKAIFETSGTDEDTLIITYPITIIFEDFSEVIVNSASELNSYRSLCASNNDEDEDIECIDFSYPISFTTYNTITDKLNTESINTDNELYEFINSIEDYVIININFPLTLTDFSGSFITINSIEELQTAIENAVSNCNENDEENNITKTEKDFISVIIQCPLRINEFEINDQHIESQFEGYKFTFNTDGTATAINSSGTIYNGVWTMSYKSNILEFTIQFDDFSIISHTWKLKEINFEDNGAQIDLIFSGNELKFKQACS